MGQRETLMTTKLLPHTAMTAEGEEDMGPAAAKRWRRGHWRHLKPSHGLWPALLAQPRPGANPARVAKESGPGPRCPGSIAARLRRSLRSSRAVDDHDLSARISFAAEGPEGQFLDLVDLR